MSDPRIEAAAWEYAVHRWRLSPCQGRTLASLSRSQQFEARDFVVAALAAADAVACQWQRLNEMATVPVGRRWRVVLEAKPDAVEMYRFNYGCNSSSVIPVDMELYAIAGKLGDVYEARLEVETKHLPEPPR